MYTSFRSYLGKWLQVRYKYNVKPQWKCCYETLGRDENITPNFQQIICNYTSDIRESNVYRPVEGISDTAKYTTIHPTVYICITLYDNRMFNVVLMYGKVTIYRSLCLHCTTKFHSQVLQLMRCIHPGIKFLQSYVNERKYTLKFYISYLNLYFANF